MIAHAQHRPVELVECVDNKCAQAGERNSKQLCVGKLG